MKILASSELLAEHLYRVQGITSGKTTMPSLAHVLLTAEGDKVRLQATDLDLAIEDTLPVTVTEAGSVALPAKSFFEVIKALPAGEVALTLGDAQRLDVRAQKAHFKVVGMASREFPALPTAQITDWVEANARDLAEMVDHTLFCVSTDDARYNLSGVYWEPRRESLRMVATDGHRLAMIDRPAAQLPKKPVIVPRRALVELRRVLGNAPDKEQVISYGFSDNHAVFRVGSVTLTARLIDGQFPDYEQVVPKNSPKKVKVSRIELSEALRRVSLLSPDKSFGVKFDLSPGVLRVASQNPALGEAEQEVSVEYDGPALQVGFNAHYVIEALGLISEGGVIVELADELSPAVITPLEKQDFSAVVMPMRI